jgi:hypothetical protein
MKRTIFISLLIILVSYTGQAKENKYRSKKAIVVEIDFGNQQKIKQVSLIWDKNITALAALQKVAEVRTHPVGQYVFVTEIDQVQAERGKMAWYYKINGKSPVHLAISQIINPGDTVNWRYVKDVCSGEVDSYVTKKAFVK